MRMDRTSQISAFDLVNNLPEEALANILKTLGQERWHKRIARAIVKERKIRPIATTSHLVGIVRKVLPHRARTTKIHPATRTFQALRIAVNRELEALEIALRKCVLYLVPHARVCTISFHSLEDRIVKQSYSSLNREKIMKIITAKPLRPSGNEVSCNPRARSAKLRVAERV
jgi:16S rRNA (cytosine1402-N4)-methyltransferase